MEVVTFLPKMGPLERGLGEKYGGWRKLNSGELGGGVFIWWRHLRKVYGGDNENTWFDSTIKWELGDNLNTKLLIDG